MTGPDLDGTSLAGALRSLEDEGYEDQFVVERDGPVRCTHCGTKSAPDELPMLAHRRIEGASDPTDEILIAGVRCPSRGTHGNLLLPYGARALRQEAGALAHMHLRRQEGRFRPSRSPVPSSSLQTRRHP